MLFCGGKIFANKSGFVWEIDVFFREYPNFSISGNKIIALSSFARRIPLVFSALSPRNWKFEEKSSEAEISKYNSHCIAVFFAITHSVQPLC